MGQSAIQLILMFLWALFWRTEFKQVNLIRGHYKGDKSITFQLGTVRFKQHEYFWFVAKTERALYCRDQLSKFSCFREKKSNVLKYRV